MKSKYVVKYRTNIIDGFTVIVKHKEFSEAIDSAWNFAQDSHNSAKHLVVSVFLGDICVYKIVRLEKGNIGKHSVEYDFKSDYGDLSRNDAHYAVFENDGGHIKPLIDYGNNADLAVRSIDHKKRMFVGFFTDKSKRLAFLWSVLLVFAMILFSFLCVVSVFNAIDGFDQGVSILAVLISIVVICKVIEYVNEYWSSCSYANFDVMSNGNSFMSE